MYVVVKDAEAEMVVQDNAVSVNSLTTYAPMTIL